MSWENTDTMRLLVAARTEVLSASKGIEFRMDQIDPTGEDREALYEDEPADTYDLRIAEVGTLWELDAKLRRANSALWELESRVGAMLGGAEGGGS